MQLSLYRAERPEVFEDIIGQKQIVRILRNQIRSNSVSQAYLFTGTHGTGKTSTARILAKAVNCESPAAVTGDGPVPCGVCESCRAIKEGRFVDVIEMDAASNNRVEDFRALIDLVKYPPSIGRYKVYIIDEVHMLTQQAENAFLKTLEEPPEHAIFILATTDPQKVRETIRSRCMQLNFRRVSEGELVDGMRRITERNGVNATEGALLEIASMANGSVRDALSILDQCMAAGDRNIDTDLVLEYTGAAGAEFFLSLTDCVMDARIGDAMVVIAKAIEAGKDARQLLKDWMEHYRNLLICRYVEKADRLIGVSPENLERLREQALRCEVLDIDRAVRLLSEYINLGRYSDKPRILMETAAVRLAGEMENVQPRSEKSSARPLNFSRTAMSEDRRVKKDPSSGERTEPEESDNSACREQRAEDGPCELTAEKQQPEGPGSAEPEGPDPVSMWRNIVSSVSRSDRSFETLVGANSFAESFENNELLVTVRKSKILFAEDAMELIEGAAKSLYGQDVYVTLRPGDIKAVQNSIRRNEAPRADGRSIERCPEPDTGAPAGMDIIEKDAEIEELVSDIESMLGVTSVEIID